MNKRTLLLTCLTASLFGCKTAPKDFPAKPIFTLKQSIIEQKFCDGRGACEVLSLCREYGLNEQGKYYHIKDHELKFCHGILGVNSAESIEIKDYIRKVSDWVKAHGK
jgi:MinD superfamily P-loop ATPase